MKYMNKKMFVNLNLIYVLLAVIFQAFAVILVKKASPQIQSLDVLSIFLFAIALLCLFCQAIVWQQALKHFDLYWAYLWMSLLYPLLLLSSVFIFQEEIKYTTIIGAFIIVGGVIIMHSEDE